MTGGLLTKRGLLLAKVQTATGVDAVPDATNDAILVSNPDYTTNPNVIQRDFVSNDLSPWEDLIGKVIAGFKFECEVRGNGVQNSGLVADAPKLATLLRGCGFALSPTTGVSADNLSQVVPNKLNSTTGVIAWAPTAATNVTVASPVLYTVEVTTPGASGVAKVTISNNNTAEDDVTALGEQTITTDTALALGAKGGSITPTFANALVAGDKWQVLAYPMGVKAVPVSDNFEVLTLYMYLDGVLHKGLDATGTFTIDATAGELAKVTFTFTASFIDPVDAALPLAPVYEETLPPQVELSLLSWGGNADMKADKWTFDAGNDVQARMDVNAAQGYIGSRIAKRTPKGGFTPEMQLNADEPFWADFLAARAKTFTVRCGTKAGNQFVMFNPNAQTSDQKYQDRNGIRALDKTIEFKRGANGNDDTMFVFC